MFIDFEGIDGSGKTTLSNMLADRLRRLGYRVTHAREGGELKAPIARKLRELTRDPANLEMSARTEFFLNVARDTQQLEEVIRPALSRGDVCISDRYLYSQVAHSSGGRGLSHQTVWPTVEAAAQGVWPDLVILVDVDPELARLRKRLGKLGNDEGTSGSRKGLVGAGLTVRVRDSFLQMARRDPSRWLVVENNHDTLGALADRIFDAVRARLEGREPEVRALSSITPRWPAATLENLETTFYAAFDELELREPGLAVYLLAGIPGLASHQRRLRHMEALPALVARTLTGLDDGAAWEMRRLLQGLTPKDVAASLGSDPSPQAMALRKELYGAAPRQVVAGLKRNDGAQAWELRERALSDGELESVLNGLSGVDSPLAWEVRDLGYKRGAYAAVARSLSGLSCDQAESLRERLFSKDRLAVLKSTTGLDTLIARGLREALFDKAPKTVLRSLTGVDAPYAWRLRRAGAPFTKEALDSVDGMEAPEAWALREAYWKQWPSTALSSLEHLAVTERGMALVRRVLAAHPRRLPILRNAYRAASRAELRRPEAVQPASTTARREAEAEAP